MALIVRITVLWPIIRSAPLISTQLPNLRECGPVLQYCSTDIVLLWVYSTGPVLEYCSTDISTVVGVFYREDVLWCINYRVIGMKRDV